jgi:stress response protein YsnF
MAEQLDIIKTELVDEATITKEPVKETKTEQVPIMNEELMIEQRPIINNSQSLPSNDYSSTEHENEEFKPVETNIQIKIPIKREEVEVTKKPYVIEELVVKKKAVTKTETVFEEIITGTFNDPQV